MTIAAFGVQFFASIEHAQNVRCLMTSWSLFTCLCALHYLQEPRPLIYERLNVQSAYKRGCTVTGKFFLTLPVQIKWRQRPKMHLIHAHCHTLHAYERQKNCLHLLPNIKQKPNIAQVFVREQQQAGSSRATPATAAAAPGSHAPLSQRKRQLLSVRERAGSSSEAFSALFQHSSPSSGRLSSLVSGL